MELSMMHVGLAAGGAALAALPVILHLFMRQTPKHVIFPALRLIRERQKQSKKRMRIKNWLLLLARMAVIAIMALALGRPSLYSQVPLGSESQPTAMGLVFDTSLSMGYIERDKTRLDEAKDRARELLAKLPDSSQVFVVDSADPPVPVGMSPAAALKRIESLTVRAVNRPLNSAMGQVYAAVADCDRPLRVVYVLTDLCRTSWLPNRPAEGLEQVERLKKKKGSRIVTFILGVAPKEVTNVALDTAEPSSTVAIQGEPIEIRGRLRSEGTKATTRVVEFTVDGKKKDEKTVQIPPKGVVEVNFMALPRGEGNLHQGKIKLSGAPDPFAVDDERFFSFRVRPPLKALLVYDDPYEAYFVAAALDPNPGASALRPVHVEKVTAKELGARHNGNLQDFAAVFLLNVKRLEEADWLALTRYVHGGGGLVVAPGHLSEPENYNSASQLLPGQLAAAPHIASPPTNMSRVTNLTHPLFERYGQDLATVLARPPVYKYWPIRGEAGAGLVLVRFDDGAPALLERTFKGPKVGKVLLWTLPLSRRADQGGAMGRSPAAFSEFPLYDPYGWSFLALMDRTVPYLSCGTSEQLNFDAGENVLLRLDPTARLSKFVISGPDQKPKPLAAPSGEYLEVPAPPYLGIWTVQATTADNRAAVLGFSVNMSRDPNHDESRFAHLEKGDFDTIFGKDGYLLAEDAAAHQEKEKLTRYGYEVFPWLMFMILTIVTLENILANTFYKEAPGAKKAGAAAA
jgi:Aerotolerance regulator N-terminal